MRNIILIVLVHLIVLNLIININYVFAVKNNLIQDNSGGGGGHGAGKETNQKSKQHAQCRDNVMCDNQSLQQQQSTKQNIQCNIHAQCTNYSTSNIVLCKDRSLCLIQYEGPFVLSNPY